jgi:hypothetical protein
MATLQGHFVRTACRFPMHATTVSGPDGRHEGHLLTGPEAVKHRTPAGDPQV